MRRGVLLAVILLLAVPVGAATVADDPDEQGIDLKKLAERRVARQRNYLPGERVMRYGAAAMEKIGEDPHEALALLRKLNMKRLNPFERALIYRLLGYVSYFMQDFQAAIENFSNAVGEEILAPRDEGELRFSIAQLYAALAQWRDVVASIDTWALYVPERSPLSYYLTAIAYYQLGEFDNAIINVEKAVDIAPDPKEGWLQLLAALYVKNQDYRSAAPVLEELVMRFRKKEYWSQLSLIYGALDDFRGSLAVQQIAYIQGLLEEDTELRRLARGYLYNDLPHPAALVLAKEMEAGTIESDGAAFELLANSWIAAREYDESLGPLQKAADLSENGNLYVRLGQVHMHREEWSDAVRLFQKAVARGDLKEPGNAHLLLGISHYNVESVARARASFARARKYEPSRRQADLWIDHIEREARQAG